MKNIKRSDVAKYCNVSQSTVSRALSDHPSIPECTKEKVKSAAKKLGYIPSNLGSTLKFRKSFQLGLIIPFSLDRKLHAYPYEYFSKLLYGLTITAQENNYRITIIPDQDLDTEKAANLVLSKKVDGLIFPINTNKKFSYISLKKMKVPFILVHNYIPDSTIPYVDVDCRPGMWDAFVYFKNIGINRVGFLSGGNNYVNSIDRLTVFKEFSQKLELKISNIVDGDFSRTSGYKSTNLFLRISLPEVIFCANDRMALGLIQGLKERGIAIPDEIRIIGFDNQDICTLISPTLSTIENPFFEIGQTAIRQLIEIIRGSIIKGISLPSKLIIRES